MKNRFGSLGRAGTLLALAAVAVPANAQTQRAAPGEGPARMTARPTVAAITRQDAMSRVYTLADDSMMGRDAGTRGNVKGTDYIAAEARRIGLLPMGENGTFFQTIPLVKRGVDPTSSLMPSGGNALTLWTDFAPLPHVGGVINVGDAMRATAAPVVYGGVWGDSVTALKPAQARGKFVVFAAPMGQNGRPDFRVWARGPLASYEGVAGMAIAVLDAAPPQLVDFFRGEQMVLKSETGHTGPGVLLVTTAAAERLLGAPIGSIQPGAAAPTPRTVTGGFRYAERATEFPARNVIAVLRGTDPVLRNQYVAVGAHNDHVGIADKAMDHDSLRVLNRLFRPEGAE
ncbi:MAG TPA: hypothetical protein VE913_12290, partial [Longimicrobium sp.]|nr:hypothetical protein [Longimicrobium sp.]